MAIYGTLPSGERITIEEWEALTPVQQANKLREWSDEARKKVSENNKNRPPASELTRQRLSEACKGRKHTEDTKNDIRESVTKSWKSRPRVMDEKTKNKISESSKGRVVSEETKAKIRAKIEASWILRKAGSR